MGGAFFSVEDDLPAVNYNPACFQLFRVENAKGIILFLNLVPPVYLFNRPEEFKIENNSISKKIVKSLSLFIKGISISYNMLNCGFLFSEELTPYNDKEYYAGKSNFFNARNFNRSHYYSFVLSFNLSRSLSIGITNNLFFIEKNDKKIFRSGTSYGLLLKPSDRYNIGLTYVDIPSDFINSRRRLDRVADETINAGFSYYINDNTLISIDLRNLSESEVRVFSLRELHLGVEKNILGHFSIRSGYFRVPERDQEERTDVYSFGVSLFDLNFIRSKNRKFNHKRPFLSYAFVLEKRKLKNIYWHFLTVSLCI